MRITAQQGNLASQLTGQTGAPAALWPGYADTVSVEFAWWPPDPTKAFTAQGVQYYNVYKNGVRIYGDGVGGAAAGVGVHPGGIAGAAYYPWYVDNNLTAGVTNTYTTRTVVGGIESPDSPSVTLSTLLNGPSVLPTAPISPSTWVQPFALPTGGTTWIVSDTTAGGTVAGTIGPTGKLSVNCGFQYALNNANIHGGDVIVLTAGQNYPTLANSGYTMPLFDGTNGWTYIISSQTPEYVGGGTLPAFSTYSTHMQLLPVTLTATPAINATSATLAPNQAGFTDATGKWLKNSGLYFVQFPVAGNFVLGGYEERQVLFTNGSAALDWNPGTSGAFSNNLYPQAGLRAASTSTLMQVAYGNHVTEVNRPAMATLTYTTTSATNFGYPCIKFPGSTTPTVLSKIRFVGISIRPGIGTGPEATFSAGPWISWPNANGNSSAFTAFPIPYGSTPPDSIYFDRCLMGCEPGDPAFAQVVHGIGNIFCNHFYVHQCQFYGPTDSIHATDTQALLMSAGGPNSIDNCYFSAGAENIIAGGLACDPIGVNNMAYQYNLNHKPLAWFDGGVNGTSATRPPGTGYASYGYFTKNLFELKEGLIWDVHDNLFLNCCASNEPGYFGAGFALGVRDQTAQPANLPLTVNCPFNRVADINIHDNEEMNVGTGFISFTGDQGTSSLMDLRIRYANNRVLLNPPLAKNDTLYGCKLAGPCVDHIIDHNTFIVNSGAPGIGNAIGIYFYSGPGYETPYLPAQGNFTPNGYTNWQDRLTITNNIFACANGPSGKTFLFDAAPQGPGSFTPFKNITYNANLSVGDPASYLPGTLLDTLANVGFKNFQGVGVIPVNPDDWNVTTGTYSTASTTAGPIGYIFGTFGIQTMTLPNATVGTGYSATLMATGGSGNYQWQLISATPDWNFWLHMNSAGVMSGLPQMVETETVVVQVTDITTLQVVQATLSLTVVHQ